MSDRQILSPVRVHLRSGAVIEMFFRGEKRDDLYEALDAVTALLRGEEPEKTIDGGFEDNKDFVWVQDDTNTIHTFRLSHISAVVYDAIEKWQQRGAET